MATLNTLRTRFGILLSAIIAFALIAFIFSLKSEMGFGGNDPIVAEVNGKDITFSEYIQEYNDIRMLNGVDESDEQQADMLYRAAWQAIITKFVMEPGYEEMGITIGDNERMAIIRGEIPTQTMYSNFFDQSTGQYNTGAINNFLMMSKGNPEAEQAWGMINEQARIERESNKYAALVSAGVNLNKLEVETYVDAANKSYSGRWALETYTTIADSLVNVSKKEIEEYYKRNKRNYKREATRTVSYVSFNITPSESDLQSIETEARTLGAGFSAAADIRAFVRESRRGTIAQNYVAESQLPSGEASVLITGSMFGPEKQGNSWHMSRVDDILIASDTLALRQIVLPYTDAALADSLYTALQKDGSAFAAAADQYSIGQNGGMVGGDIGKVPFSAFTEEFATKLAPAKSGTIVKFEIGDMVQLIQVYEAGRRTKHYRVASIELPIVPSNDTRNMAHNKAGTFAVEAKSNESFNNAAGESGVAPHNANITAATRSIPSISGSREITRWAHTAKLGDISPIFNVEDGYVVAKLTGINDSEYSSIEAVTPTIKRILMNNKKYDMIASSLSGSTLDEKAESLDVETFLFEDVNFNSTYITGLGIEPRVLGTICSSSKGQPSNGIKGSNGLYIIEVEEITESEEPASAEAEKVRVESMTQQMVQQMLFMALESMADVKDLRGKAL